VAALLTVRVLFNDKVFGKKQLEDRVLFIGFGSPTVGDKEFANCINKYYSQNFHFYINKREVVVDSLIILNDYEHFGTFIYLDEDGDYEISYKFDLDMKSIDSNYLDNHSMKNYFQSIYKIYSKDPFDDQIFRKENDYIHVQSS
jgi:hypothetical protein